MEYYHTPGIKSWYDVYAYFLRRRIAAFESADSPPSWHYGLLCSCSHQRHHSSQTQISTAILLPNRSASQTGRRGVTRRPFTTPRAYFTCGNILHSLQRHIPILRYRFHFSKPERLSVPGYIYLGWNSAPSYREKVCRGNSRDWNIEPFPSIPLTWSKNATLDTAPGNSFRIDDLNIRSLKDIGILAFKGRKCLKNT